METNAGGAPAGGDDDTALRVGGGRGEAVPDDSVEWTEGAVNITRDLTLNDEGDDVSALQTALTDLCYYSGDVTGRYGEATKTAVEDFQRDFCPLR